MAHLQKISPALALDIAEKPDSLHEIVVQSSKSILSDLENLGITVGRERLCQSNYKKRFDVFDPSSWFNKEVPNFFLYSFDITGNKISALAMIDGITSIRKMGICTSKSHRCLVKN